MALKSEMKFEAQDIDKNSNAISEISQLSPFPEVVSETFDHGIINEMDMGEEMGASVSLSFGRSMKARDPIAIQNSFDRKVNMTSSEVSLSPSACRVRVKEEEIMFEPQAMVTDYSKGSMDFSVDELLSQLQFLARFPKRLHKLQNEIFIFLLGFVGHAVFKTRELKRRTELGEKVKLDDVKDDSYWTKWILKNSYDQKMPITSNKNPQLRQRVSQNSPMVAVKLESGKVFSSWEYSNCSASQWPSAKRIKHELLPAELVLNFCERHNIPSEMNLNKIFKRFGPLFESETQIDHDCCRAKVIFKRGSDAHVARNSAEKFNILGGSIVSYHIGYKLESGKDFSRWEYSNSSTSEQQSAKRIKHEILPAELVLNFSERNSIPSEMNLNKIFKRFGPLFESETQIDHDCCRAKVTFKRGSDAQVARNSAEKFNIFGGSIISYHIAYKLPSSQQSETLMQ